MLGFLKPAPDAEQKISEEKVPRLYKILANSGSNFDSNGLHWLLYYSIDFHRSAK